MKSFLFCILACCMALMCVAELKLGHPFYAAIDAIMALYWLGSGLAEEYLVDKE